jgi:thiol-disulfide isomerase/thioredoxin
MTRLLLAAVLAATLLTGCSGSSSAPAGFVSGDGSITVIDVADRVPAPLVEGETLDGTAWSSAGSAGRVLVYNVWGSWCAPCRAEAPALAATATATADVADFVGLNTRDLDRSGPQAFVRGFGIGYPNLFDPDGSLLLGFAPALPAAAIPSTLVVDAQGRLAARVLGATTEATLTALVRDVAEGR